MLSGPSRAERTTVAALLVEQVSHGVLLSLDAFHAMIRRGRLEPWRPQAHAQNTTVLTVLAVAAAGYADGGFQVVVEGMIRPDQLAPFRAALGAGLFDAVLRHSPAGATQVAAGAGGGAPPGPDAGDDPSVRQALQAQLADLGELASHAVATTGLAPEQIAAAVAGGCLSGMLELV